MKPIKPIIFIMGNMGSGKSTVGYLLAKELKTPYCSIDYCRNMVGNGRMSGEYKAWGSFFKEIEGCESTGGVFELSGTGQHVRHIKFMLYSVRNNLESQDKPFCAASIILDCKKEICLARSNNPDRIDVPFPYNMEKEKIIDYIEKELYKDYIDYQLGIMDTLRINSSYKNPQEIVSLIKDFLKEKELIS